MSIDQPGSAAPEAAGAGDRRPVTGDGERHGPVAASVAWATAPIYTIGLGTWAVFLYAAIKRRSWLLGGASAIYAVLLVVFGIAESPGKPGALGASIGALAWLMCGLGGAAHALAIRRRVFFPDPQTVALEQAEEKALERRKLRERARQLAQHDPGLARELGIGRPDLRRNYDDGGLVDVNHAPAAALETLPGMTAELAAQAVAMRRERGAFVSADDLCNALQMPAETVPDLADLTIYPA